MNDPVKLCEIIAVRHGQTVSNASATIQGQSCDSPLDELGTSQIEAIGRRLASEHIDAVYSSDLGRAMQSSRIITGHLRSKHDIQPVSELREWNLGLLEGHNYHEMLRQHPELAHVFGDGNEDVSVPGGESHAQFFSRVSGFLDRIAKENRGRRILVVTHAGAIACMFRHVVGKVDPRNKAPRAANASYSKFIGFDGGSWQMVCWNDCSHLHDIKQNESKAY